MINEEGDQDFFVTERANNFRLYSHLFSMPNVPWPMTRFWYSFNSELAHIVRYQSLQDVFPSLFRDFPAS